MASLANRSAFKCAVFPEWLELETHIRSSLFDVLRTLFSSEMSLCSFSGFICVHNDFLLCGGIAAKTALLFVATRPSADA